MLRLRFSDADELVELREGRRIKDIFSADGEGFFRRLESEILKVELESGIGVLSTGGGVVVDPRNRSCLRQLSRVTYLRALPHQLLPRIRRDGTRPLLQTADPLKTLEELFAVRDPLYREVAHLVVDVQSGSAAKTAERVIAAWEAVGWLLPQSGDETKHSA